MPNQHRVQEADHWHYGVIEKLMEASNASHFSPQHEQLPVWRTAREKEKKKEKEKEKNWFFLYCTARLHLQPILPIFVYLLAMKSHFLKIWDYFDGQDTSISEHRHNDSLTKSRIHV